MREIPLLALTMGDPAGIGPELLVHAFSDEKLHEEARLVAVGDKDVMECAIKQLGLKLGIRVIESLEKAEFKKGIMDMIDMDNVGLEHFAIGRVNKVTGKAAVQYTEKAVEMAMRKEVDGVVSAPINKEAMHLAGYNYPGQTELFARLTHTQQYAMVLIFGPIRLFFLTNHISLQEIFKKIKKDLILARLELICISLKQFAIDRPHIAVAGLNPHAGEGGRLGHEERDEIIPAIEEARRRGINVEGPFPPDTLFLHAREGKFDAVLVMYHDQGNIPAKLLGFGSGVTVVAGLPFVRTSVAHGTAYDIAGKGIARPETFLAAIRTAATLSKEWQSRIEGQRCLQQKM